MSSLVAIERVSIQDLKGKTVYELEPEEFEKLFCQRCCDYGSYRSVLRQSMAKHRKVSYNIYGVVSKP